MGNTKFRAKDLSNNQWVYGFYFETGNNSEGWIVEPDYEEHPELSGNPIEDLTSCYPVDIDTVGQFTGLKDKKGKDVYEGDIVGYGPDDPSIAKVVFHKGYYGLIYNTWKPDSRPSIIDDLDTQTMELIGNIYDSPELFEPQNY
ncbi:YopX family protein [Flagellimonas sp. CMM7]|uniref:YopX family protein n=1 Tax=Flagellimonas sp. CMM7 TaxID=2654676 RepID=UPI0013D55C81|nr:YopX family protein [Flagellimonas sp. CMM7]UII80034.1 YopX family protein [Flagellimonas sp. CMM7]